MGYLPGLDGIRAIAVIGVLLYHANLTWLEGGFLGVDVFFVLSGFLITTLIVEEFDRSGRIDFKQFYLRRARRLLPAVLLMLVVVSILAAFIYRDAAAQVRTDAIASLFYVTNWWYIVSDASYFEAIGRPALLQHLWSLAVEEQFYLVWPAVVYALLRWTGKRSVIIVALALSIASTLWMATLAIANGYPELADPSRAYFGTDSHVMGLLLGAAFAIVWRPGHLRSHLTAGAQMLITFLGFAAVAGLVWVYTNVGEYSPALYRGGFLALSVLVCVLIAAASHPGAPFGRILGAQPMRWIGQRSYGLYLWHWPIFMITRPNLDIPLDGIPLLILRLGLTCLVAELSYRYVEMPIRRGAIGAFWRRWRAEPDEERTVTTRRVLVGAGTGLAVLAITGFALATAPSARDGQIPADVAAAIGIDDGGPTQRVITGPAPSESTATPGSPTGGVTTDPTTSATGEPTPTESPTADGPRRNANGYLTAVGDSVMLGVAEQLMGTVKGTQVDAEVSRQASGVLDRIRALADAKLLAPTVVVHTGTNGVITEDQLREMLDILSDRDLVVFMNVNVPRSWMKPNNELIERIVPEYPNVVIGDWYAASKDNPEYFVSDGVHPQWPKGIKTFVKVITDAAGFAT
jgi:peptidoglycan/LPS O-acetylase OafA/YrhL